jgi:hypothetical protein
VKNTTQITAKTTLEGDFHSNYVKFISHHPLLNHNPLKLLLPNVGTNSALIKIEKNRKNRHRQSAEEHCLELIYRNYSWEIHMRTPLAKIALIVLICCLITLMVGAEMSGPAKPTLSSAPIAASSPAY